MNATFGHLFAARSMRRGISSACLFIALTISVVAQTAGNIRVTVRDFAGDAVPGATVTAIGRDPTVTRTATTPDSGEVVITNLTPGIYTITVKAPGFAMTTVEDVQVTTGQSQEIPVELRLSTGGRSLASVTAIEPSEAVATGLQPSLSALPNLNDDLTPLLQTVPGAVAAGASTLGKVAIDGRGNDQQTVRLDGLDYTSQVDFPSADAAVNPVGSFQKPSVAGDLDNAATRSGAFGYEPRHGPGTGSVSEITTFAGPDTGWKLQLYGDHVNDAFNARNYFDYDGKNALRRTRFGAKFGTALGEMKRTSLFLAYEGWRGRTERNVYEAVPVGVTTGPLAALVPAFVPPGTELIPGASLNSDFEVARRRTRTTAESNAFDIRLDYRPLRPLVNRDKCPYPDQRRAANPTSDFDPARAKECSLLTLRFTRQAAENFVPDGVTGRTQRQRFLFVNGLVGWKMATRTKHVFDEFSPKDKEFGHQFRFGFNLTRAQLGTELPTSTGAVLSQSLVVVGGTVPVRGLSLPPVPTGVPLTVPNASLGSLVRGSGRGFDFKPLTYSASYDYSTEVKGRHELYAGAEARFIRFDLDRLGGLTYTFPTVAALRTGTPGTITYLSDLSAPSPFSEGTGRRRARQQAYMGYVQMVSQFHNPSSWDTNLEPALTLTYGLRYDYFSGVRERGERAVVVDPLSGRILPPGSPFYRVDKVNLQPRFGLAYRFGEGPLTKRTLLRAGIGLYSGVPRIGDLLLPVDSDRFSTAINGGAFPFSTADMVRSFVQNPLTRQFQPVAFAQDFSPLERSLKWDVRIGQKRAGYDFSAYYTGNIGRNLALANFANRITSIATNPDPTKPAVVTREFGDAFGEFFYRRGGGHSSYNALSLQVSRNVSDQQTTSIRWLKIPVADFNAKYTLSRSVGNVTGTIMSNPLDPDGDFGYNSGIARHSFTLSAVYNLWQLGKNPDNRNHPLLGWQVMPSLKVTSGLPLIIRINRPDVVYVDAGGTVYASPAAGRTAVLNTSGGGSSGGAYVPEIVPGASPLFRDSLELLNPAAFAIPAPGQLGNLRRGQFRGPGAVQLDLGLRRNLFGKKEKTRGEFRLDFYNVFNRANFTNPAVSLPGLLGASAADNQFQPHAPLTRAGASAFGVVTSADTSRLIQFSFALRFNEGFTK